MRKLTDPSRGFWDSEPSWSPDSAMIAFTRVPGKRPNRPDLFTMNSRRHQHEKAERKDGGSLLAGLLARWQEDRLCRLGGRQQARRHGRRRHKRSEAYFGLEGHRQRERSRLAAASLEGNYCTHTGPTILYSPMCVEGEISELRLHLILGSWANKLPLW